MPAKIRSSVSCPCAGSHKRPGVVEGVETPPGSCPQGCGFASVALAHRNEIAIMRSAHFLWRSERRAERQKPTPRDERYYCWFCGKARSEVRVLIRGNAYICNECVAECNAIIAEHDARQEPRP